MVNNGCMVLRLDILLVPKLTFAKLNESSEFSSYWCSAVDGYGFYILISSCHSRCPHGLGLLQGIAPVLAHRFAWRIKALFCQS